MGRTRQPGLEETKENKKRRVLDYAIHVYFHFIKFHEKPTGHFLCYRIFEKLFLRFRAIFLFVCQFTLEAVPWKELCTGRNIETLKVHTLVARVIWPILRWHSLEYWICNDWYLEVYPVYEYVDTFLRTRIRHLPGVCAHEAIEPTRNFYFDFRKQRPPRANLNFNDRARVRKIGVTQRLT